MAVCIVRLGTSRTPGEGLRIGTARRDFYDVGMPLSEGDRTSSVLVNRSHDDTGSRQSASQTSGRAEDLR